MNNIQIYYLHHSLTNQYEMFSLIIVRNNRCYNVYYRCSNIINSAKAVMEVLEDLDGFSVSLLETRTQPNRLTNWKKFTSVDVLRDYIRTVMCFDAL
mgnify:CR=1 FL=1